MKVIWLLSVLLICAVNCKPTSEDDYDYTSDDGPMLKDTEDDEYGTDEEAEEFPGDTPPSFVTKPQDFFAKATETLYLPCEVLNGESHVIMWQKNQTLLFQDMIQFGGEKDKFERMKNGTLVIKNVDSSDTGVYICKIPLDKEDKIEIAHHVYVETAPKIESLTALNDLKKLKAGDTLTLTCNVSGIPKPEVKWYFSKESVSSHTGETLEINNIGYNNVGRYRCMADNKVEPPAHRSLYVSLLHKPVVRIDEIQSNGTVQELRCVVDANPPAHHIKWKYNGTAIESNENIVLRQKNNVLRLNFNEFKEADFGSYSCLAKNDLGPTEEIVQVNLLPQRPHLLSITPSHKYVELTWTVQSSTSLTENTVEYKREQDEEWKSEKAIVVKDSDGMYTIAHNFTDLRHGKYLARLSSSNEYGMSEFSDDTKFAVKGHSRHHHSNEKKRIYDEGATMTEPRESQAALPNESVLNDQEDTARTGSQVSTAVNLAPHLTVTILVLGLKLMLQ